MTDPSEVLKHIGAVLQSNMLSAEMSPITEVVSGPDGTLLNWRDPDGNEQRFRISVEATDAPLLPPDIAAMVDELPVVNLNEEAPDSTEDNGGEAEEPEGCTNAETADDG